MASVKSDISLQIKNNLNRTATFSVLGGTQDPSNGQANAKTIYEWDLTAESFANTTVVTIEASTIDNPVIINYEVQNQDGAVTDLETVVRLLNTLNLGVFNLDGNTIWIIDDINIFGNIEVLVSLSFDINVFVQEAYNYFDPLGKTPLVDFQTKYTSVIQQAVDTIPDFVDFVESQGWSLCYPTNATEISIVRFSAGSFFYITDIGGVLTTNEATSGTSITQAGLENTLLYATDISIWTTLQEIEFLAPPLITDDGYIFKFIFETTISTNFIDDGLSVNAWTPVDSTYFVNAENQDILVELKPNNALNLYGSDFPNIVQPNGYEILFRSINGRVELIPDGFGTEKLIFNEISENSVLAVEDIYASTTSVVNCDFSTFVLNNPIGMSIRFSFYNSVALLNPQTIQLDINFNTKFAQLVPSTSYRTFLINGSELTNSNDPVIVYQNTITELELNFNRINFSESVTQNLPPIKQIGHLTPTGNYELRMTMLNQNTLALGVGREMEYFNNWYYELGTQDFLSQNNVTTTSGLGIIDFGSNTYVLSGQGIYGINALGEAGFTNIVPTGAITPNMLTFTQKEGELVLVRTTSVAGNSNFQITSAQKNQAETVANSSLFAVGTEQIQFSAPALGEDNNCIFTLDPTLDCTSVYIGTNPPFTPSECLTTFICGNGIFNAGIDMDTLNLNGLVIELPIDGALGDAYGLYQRDFSGINGNNFSNQVIIRYFKINATQFFNPLVAPYGSNALFNFGVNGIIPSIPRLVFEDCDFATDINDTSASPSPLDLLIPVGTRIQDGIRFIDCGFNYTASTFGGEINFNINNGAVLGIPTQTALLGNSEIESTQFGAFGNDTIRLVTNYNGTGDTLSSLTFKDNPDLVEVKLTNFSTAVPLPISLTFDNNPLLNTIDFQNYNMNNFNIIGTLPSVTTMNVNDNDLNTVDLDNIIVALDNNGLTLGNLDYSNQTGGASPNIGVSGSAYNNLLLKGWTVVGNVPI